MTVHELILLDGFLIQGWYQQQVLCPSVTLRI